MIEEVRLCEECGDPIAPKRIQIVPNTKYCIECAQDLELERSRYSERKPSGLGQEWLDGTVEELEDAIDG